MESNTKKPRFWTKLHDVAHRHPYVMYFIAGIGIIIAASLIAFAILYRPPQEIVSTPKMAPKPEIMHYSPLTGKKVANEAATTQLVTAIMIENSPDARPQSGLRQAGVVYEAIAEGGITRFLALYQQEKPQLIGPVRSLRTYFVDWVAPYNASVAHVGGSKAALDEIRNGSYRDIDQFFNAEAYWRASDRFAPHNVYTSFKRLDTLNNAKDFTSSEFTSFARADGKPATALNATSVTVNVSSPTFNSSYAYDKTSNSYARSQGGAPHLDREDGQINPAVIVALSVDMQNVMEEDGYREKITTTGSGTAQIFQNGTVIEATWSKEDRSSELRLIDDAGKSIALNRGQTWITAVPNGSGSVTWQ